MIGALATQALLEGDVEAFLDRAQRAADAFDRAGDVEAAGIEQASLGAAYRALGVWDRAERALSRVTAVSEGVASRVLLDRARVCSARGAMEEARALATRAAAGFAAGGDAVGEGAARGYLVGILAALGDAGAAGAEARRTGELLAGAASGRAFAGAASSRALVVDGRIAEALAAAEQAAGAAVEAGHLLEGDVIVRLALADARAQAGDHAGAAVALGEARRRVLADAYKLRDPALRRAFLEDVPEHRRTLDTRR